MSLIIRHVLIETDGSGDDVSTVSVPGATLRAVNVDLKTLVTPDITITEEPTGTTLLAVSSPSDGARYVLAVQAQGDDGSDLAGAFVPPVVLGRILVTVASGGANKVGRVTLAFER